MTGEGEDKETVGKSNLEFTVTRGQLTDIYKVLNLIIDNTGYEIFKEDTLKPLMDHFGGKESTNDTPPLNVPADFLQQLFSSDDKRLAGAQYIALYSLAQESRNTTAVIRSSLYLADRYIEKGSDQYQTKIAESISPMTERFVNEIRVFNFLSPTLKTRAESGSAEEDFLGLYGLWTGKNGELNTTLTAISKQVENTTVELGRRGLPSDILHPTLENLANVLQSE